MTPKEFIDAIAPAAKTSSLSTGVPASFTVAEAALESGWGEHAPGMNLFGVKADKSWTGPVVTRNTKEFVKGQWIVVPARFRAYSEWLGSITDHAEFLTKNKRYAPAFATKTGEAFARAVAAAGYATDPAYADKIIAVMRAHNLGALDA